MSLLIMSVLVALLALVMVSPFAAIKRDVSLAANANNDDQLTTDGVRLQHRIAQMDGMVQLLATASATGLRLTVSVGDQVEGANMEPFISATGPLIPDHVVGSWPIIAGESVALSVLNTTAGALTLRYTIQIP